MRRTRKIVCIADHPLAQTARTRLGFWTSSRRMRQTIRDDRCLHERNRPSRRLIGNISVCRDIAQEHQEDDERQGENAGCDNFPRAAPARRRAQFVRLPLSGTLRLWKLHCRAGFRNVKAMPASPATDSLPPNRSMEFVRHKRAPRRAYIRASTTGTNHRHFRPDSI